MKKRPLIAREDFENAREAQKNLHIFIISTSDEIVQLNKIKIFVPGSNSTTSLFPFSRLL